jgi:GT2 family glycosyltransferase
VSNETETTGTGPTDPAVEFSVVIPTRDRPRALARCLESLARQTYPLERFEVIVVDDGSDPPVPDPGASRNDGLRVHLFRQANAGPAAARNAGAEHAAGELLAFTDDDCTPAPAWLEVMEKRLREGDAPLLGGSIVNALPDNAFSTASQELVTYVYGYFNSPSPRFFCSNNLATTKEAFASIGGFDTSFPFAAGEDRDFCDRWHFSGRPLEYVAEARMNHAHTLDLRRYWRQHFRYGRAAAYHHRMFADRRGERVKVEPLGFYLRLVAHPFGRMNIGRAVACAGLLIVSQAANALGFVYESLSRTGKDTPISGTRK